MACSLLGGGATDEAEGHVDGTPRESVTREAMCPSRGDGATAEVEGHVDGTPRDSMTSRIVQMRR